MENTENMIEFISGTRSATVSFTNPKHIRKIKELYEEHPDDFKYFKLNQDGSVCAKIPLKWIRIGAGRTGTKREMTEEQKQALMERLAAGRAKAAKKK
jgi:hypothetical protein